MKVKDRVTLELTLAHKFEYETTYGYRTQYNTIYIMVDAERQQYKWNTTGTLIIESTDKDGTYLFEPIDIGDRFILKGTVKDFTEYKGTPQIVLTRCKAIKITHKAPTKEEKEEQRKQEQLNSLKKGDFIWEMPYKQYKEHYSDCETLAGSFVRSDKEPARISVIIRNGRLKNSGTRGKRYSGYRLENEEGKALVYRAVSMENAIKRAYKEYPENTWECTKVYEYKTEGIW